MARNSKDIAKDTEMLKKISIGSQVQYLSKSGEVKNGVVSKITKYKNYCREEFSSRRYSDYSSVTIILDNGKHINVSPRNLLVIRKENIMGKSITKEELAILLDARDKLCGFCENDACEKCQVTMLIDDAYADCKDLEEE